MGWVFNQDLTLTLHEQDILEHWLNTDSEEKHSPTKIGLRNSFFKDLDFQGSVATSDCIQSARKKKVPHWLCATARYFWSVKIK